MNSMPAFPDLIPSTTFSFTSAYTHQTAPAPPSSTIRRPRSNSTNRRRPARRESDQNHTLPENSTSGPSNGARRDDRHNAQANGQAVTRARTRRILLGERPAGTQLNRESEELSDQEEAVYHAEASMGVRTFGHALLLPPGRRQTQTEQDYPPSPTPSDAPEQEHRQEDQAESPDGVGVEAEVEAAAEDLDGEVEDRDDSGASEEDDTMDG